MLTAIDAYLARHAESLRLLRRATALDHCKFDLDFAKGFEMVMPHLAKMRGAARLFALEGVQRTESGEADAAAESLRACLRLGSALRQEPTLISALVRIACDATAVRQVERWASRTRPSPRALLRVEEALRAEADPKMLVRALVAERCAGIHTFQTHVLRGDRRGLAKLLQGGLEGGERRRAALLGILPQAYFKADMVNYLDLMNEYVAAARNAYPTSFIAGARLGRGLEKKLPRHYLLSSMLLPALGRMFVHAQRHMATCEAARTALATLRYRARHGRLPENLQALAPGFVKSVPPDPFDGKPLRYRKKADGFVIYAVGEDGRDDGGDTERPNRLPADVGFRVRWPKAGF